jgi:murein DD-endopeptidase MepM/ murein hydrolase activator NlpD
MRNNYYIFVVAHSIRGRIRRIHVPQYFVYICALFALIGFITVAGAAGSYGRMLLKVAKYNHLRSEAETLKQKYDRLQNTMAQTEVQLASLQSLASQVSVAYGIVRPGGSGSLSAAPPSANVEDSKEQFELLLRASYTPPSLRQELFSDRPTRAALRMDWPVEGRLTSGFSDRLDPFNGEGGFHTGIDISCPYGLPVHAATDGVVLSVARESGYGLTVILEHGRGVRTLYAHLSGFNVTPGQSVLGGEIIGYVGRSGRATGSHLHFEVRNGDTPVPPLGYLRRFVASSPFRLQGDD